MKLIPKNPNFKERILDHLTRQNFMNHISFELHSIEAGRTEGEMDILPIHLQQDGFLHGGVVATIADIVSGFAAYTLVPATMHVVTGEIKISYFAKGKGQKVKAVGTVIKPGKRMNFCEAEVFSIDAHGEKLIAKATTSMITI